MKKIVIFFPIFIIIIMQFCIYVLAAFGSDGSVRGVGSQVTWYDGDDDDKNVCRGSSRDNPIDQRYLGLLAVNSS